MAESPRLWAIQEVTRRGIRSLPEMASGARVLEAFGSNTFDVAAMREKLSKPTFGSLQETIRRGKRLDAAIAGEVAHAVKDRRSHSRHHGCRSIRQLRSVVYPSGARLVASMTSPNTSERPKHRGGTSIFLRVAMLVRLRCPSGYGLTRRLHRGKVAHPPPNGPERSSSCTSPTRQSRKRSAPTS